jgi:putative DNA methylase
LLKDRINVIEDEHIRDVFICLLSGILEFNNMFASFKGEGTGAVRHMFSHHILKPERMPLEANLWGTPKSSGAFSTLFESRLLRGIEYAENPFELSIADGSRRKIYGLSQPIPRERASSFNQFSSGGFDLYISCGDSSSTDIKTGCIDVVITDPPFFDNVNYSQLADFFYVWQRHILADVGDASSPTTRSEMEVQQGDADAFADRLAGVWREAHRVLKPEGLLIFTYHHSRPEGWSTVLDALVRAGFVVTASQPIKGEMSVAAPKQQAKEPIDLDIIIVCREWIAAPTCEDFGSAVERAKAQISRLRSVNRKMSRNDIRVILMGQILRVMSCHSPSSVALKELQMLEKQLDQHIDELHEVRS